MPFAWGFGPIVGRTFGGRQAAGRQAVAAGSTAQSEGSTHLQIPAQHRVERDEEMGSQRD